MEGSKKRNPYKTNIILLILISGLFMLSHVLFFAFRNTIDQPPLPGQYAGYLPLGAAAKSNALELKLLVGDPGERRKLFPPLRDPKTGMILLHALQEETNSTDVNVYYRIDANGTLLDSLRVEDYDISLNREYIIHPDYYYSWFLDGSSGRQEYLPVNKDLKLGTEALRQEYEALYKKATLVQFFGYQMLWGKNGVTEGDRRRFYDTKTDKVIFLIQNKWHALFGKDLEGMPGGEKKATLDSIKALNLDRLGVPNPYLYVANFHKESQGYQEWNGMAYLNLMLGKDTLKLKTEMTVKESEGEHPLNYHHQLQYFRDETMSFPIIINENYQCYILKSRSVKKL
ncbi:hypothetical protein DBR43_15765 [Pedobacter sp. KBW06]|uniref:hypothetical protein n=1 Tax=Pedobacter sp. KBW06 TaxID=2153359 RepID=UPI000F598658|nr:hypothetical protein [Pedobacter sp. KBW06]RQO69531.1 hypothetical protein DBR43_15765 [Pedobacter sp. KBW06]